MSKRIGISVVSEFLPEKYLLITKEKYTNFRERNLADTTSQK